MQVDIRPGLRPKVSGSRKDIVGFLELDEGGLGSRTEVEGFLPGRAESRTGDGKSMGIEIDLDLPDVFPIHSELKVTGERRGCFHKSLSSS